MPDFLKDLLSADGFMPHGHCYLWRPGLVWLHVISDTLVALSYTSIPFTLLYFVRRRRDLPFHWMFLCFGVFIIACGTTHAMEVWTLWTPTYWLAGAIKAITAAASVPTAILLIKLVPRALAIPTPAQLARANQELQRAHEILERRVAERTAELTRKNRELAGEIAERKRAEAALVKSEGRLHRLAESGILGIVTTDAGGTVRAANRAYLDLVGYTEDDVAAGRVRSAEMTPPEHAASEAAARQELRVTGVVQARETEYIRKDGSRVPVLVGGAAIGAAIDAAGDPANDAAGDAGGAGSDENIAFVFDLTERKRAEAAVRRLEKEREADAKLGALLEAAPDAMVIADAAGRIVLVNAEAEKLFDYPRDQLLEQPVELLVPERLRDAHAARRARYAEHPTGRRAMGGGQPLVGRRRDGSEFPVEIRLGPIPTRDGVLVSSAIRDVTERERDEQALRLAKETAETACGELESFSYSVAHDLRAPLRAMSGYSSTLLEDYGARFDADGRDRLERIVAGARRMSEIIDALLLLARLSRAEPRREPVDLSLLAHKVIDQLRSGEPERSVEFVAAGDLVVHGDPDLLRVLLDNLLGNAWKFTGKQPSARIELGREAKGAAVYFVRDNGAGFDMAYADKLFAPFKRLHTPAQFAGTGIGLATVQRIVRRHGGKVWAHGAESLGATFHFTLPAEPRGRPDTLPQLLGQRAGAAASAGAPPAPAAPVEVR